MISGQALNLIKENETWINEIWDKIEKKLSRTARTTDKYCFPYTTKNGRFVPYGESQSDLPNWWTNGFWCGILWIMYEKTGDLHYKNAAENYENLLDKVIEDFNSLHHDVGFMWLYSSVANYKLTGNEKSRTRALHVANTLAGRFNPQGNYICAWNSPLGNPIKCGWAIIDCMMNLPLLYWASEVSGDPRYRQIAMRHADTNLKHFLRADGSSKHIVSFNPESGEYIECFAGGGFAPDSSWARGQGWALYGMALSYMYTGKQEYLEAAKRVAHYFISCLPDDGIAACDLRAPLTPVYKDASAGVCAACGLIEVAKAVPAFEQVVYLNAALKILKSTNEQCCDWSDQEDSIVQMNSESYPKGAHHIPLIYADYYFIEAVTKLEKELGDRD